MSTLTADGHGLSLDGERSVTALITAMSTLTEG
jgi:hypothetical protein